MKRKNINKKNNNKIGKTVLLIIWIISIILGIINILLYNVAMGNVGMGSNWYWSLLKASNSTRAMRYYICAAIDLVLFCILVLIYRKKEKIYPMLLALTGFTIQIILLMWKIKI